MWASIFMAITKIFMGLGTLGEAFNHGAAALNHVALMAEESAATLSDEARIVRKAKHAAMLKEHNVTDVQAPALPSPV